MSGKYDYQTSTISGARAFAEAHAEWEPDDTPTAAECRQEEFELNFECPECPAGYDDMEFDGHTCTCTSCGHTWDEEPDHDDGR